jgi:hypothetical protein
MSQRERRVVQNMLETAASHIPQFLDATTRDGQSGPGAGTQFLFLTGTRTKIFF